MKRKILIGITISTVLLSSCIKQIDKTFTGTSVAEIDATVLNSVASGVDYPILTRIPTAGRPISTTIDSTLRRWNGTVRVRLNLVGPQSNTEQTVGYRLFPTPITTIAFPATISGQTPTMGSGTLNVSDAVAGTHYTALSGKATIPPGSSFAFIDINIVNNGAMAGQGRFIGIQLDSTGSILPSLNYRRIGLVIDQR